MKRWLKIVIATTLILLTIATLSFVWWGSNPLPAMPEALSALESDEAVLVVPKEWIVFSPLRETAVVGVILYPGGRVAPVAYAPLARSIAEAGYLVIVPRMPLNFAFFDLDVADEIMVANPMIQSWVIGGALLRRRDGRRICGREPRGCRWLVLMGILLRPKHRFECTL